MAQRGGRWGRDVISPGSETFQSASADYFTVPNFVLYNGILAIPDQVYIQLTFLKWKLSKIAAFIAGTMYCHCSLRLSCFSPVNISVRTIIVLCW